MQMQSYTKKHVLVCIESLRAHRAAPLFAGRRFLSFGSDVLLLGRLEKWQTLSFLSSLIIKVLIRCMDITQNSINESFCNKLFVMAR